MVRVMCCVLLCVDARYALCLCLVVCDCVVCVCSCLRLVLFVGACNCLELSFVGIVVYCSLASAFCLMYIVWYRALMLIVGGGCSVLLLVLVCVRRMWFVVRIGCRCLLSFGVVVWLVWFGWCVMMFVACCVFCVDLWSLLVVIWGKACVVVDFCLLLVNVLSFVVVWRCSLCAGVRFVFVVCDVMRCTFGIACRRPLFVVV